MVEAFMRRGGGISPAAYLRAVPESTRLAYRRGSNEMQAALLGESGGKLFRQGGVRDQLSRVVKGMAETPGLERLADAHPASLSGPLSAAYFLAGLTSKKFEYPGTLLLQRTWPELADFRYDQHDMSLENKRAIEGWWRMLDDRIGRSDSSQRQELPALYRQRWSALWKHLGWAATARKSYRDADLAPDNWLMRRVAVSAGKVNRTFDKREDTLLASAMNGDLSFAHLAELMAELSGKKTSGYKVPQPSGFSAADRIVSHLKSSAGDALPRGYARDVWRGVGSFFLMSGLLLRGVRTYGAEAWDRVNPAVSLGVLNALNVQEPLVLGAEHMAKAVALRAAGKHIVILPRHQGLIDTLYVCPSTHLLKPRPWAKGELWNIPGFGYSALDTPMQPVTWDNRACLETSTPIWRGAGDVERIVRVAREKQLASSGAHVGSSAMIYFEGGSNSTGGGVQPLKTGFLEFARSLVRAGEEVWFLSMTLSGHNDILTKPEGKTALRGLGVGARPVIQFHPLMGYRDRPDVPLAHQACEIWGPYARRTIALDVMLQDLRRGYSVST